MRVLLQILAVATGLAAIAAALGGLLLLAEAGQQAEAGRGLLAARAEGQAVAAFGLAAQAALVSLAAGGLAGILARLDRLIERTPLR